MKFFVALMFLFTSSGFSAFASQSKFATSNSYAMPKTGDKADYVISQTGNAVGTMSMELTAFDSVTAEYTRVTTTTAAGKPPSTNVEQVKASDLLSDEAADQMLADCARDGNSPEHITVQAGAFDVCHMKMINMDLFIGKVPFGMIRVEMSQGLTFELVDFKLGQ